MAPKLHASYLRLVEYASKASIPALEDAPDRDLALRNVLGVSSAVFTNWKSRGISKEGALSVQRKLGCSATWLLTGAGSIAAPSSVQEPPPPPGMHLVDESQWLLLQDFEMLSEEDRHAIRATLSEKATQMRKIYDEFRRRHNIPPPAPNEKVAATIPPAPKEKRK